MENKRLFIHIGAHKTASTYFQQQVFPNLTCHYSPAMSRELRWAVCGEQNEPQGDIDLVKGYIRDCSCDVLLSHETLVGHFKNGYKNFENNIRVLHSHFPTAEILFFTREKEDWFYALYREAVRTQKETRSYDAFRFEFDIEKAVAYMQQYFTTHVFEFESFRANPERFTEQFEHALGVKFYGRHTSPVRTGLSPIQLPVARTLNRVGGNRKTSALVMKLLP